MSHEEKHSASLPVGFREGSIQASKALRRAPEREGTDELKKSRQTLKEAATSTLINIMFCCPTETVNADVNLYNPSGLQDSQGFESPAVCMAIRSSGCGQCKTLWAVRHSHVDGQTTLPKLRNLVRPPFSVRSLYDRGKDNQKETQEIETIWTISMHNHTIEWSTSGERNCS